MSQRRPDNELTAAELERRNRRRARNREAATRQRDRRIFQVQNLESRVEQLRTTKVQLSQENEQLRNQVEEAKRQFYDMTGYQYSNPNEQNSNSNSNQEIFYHVWIYIYNTVFSCESCIKIVRSDFIKNSPSLCHQHCNSPLISRQVITGSVPKCLHFIVDTVYKPTVIIDYSLY